LTEHAIEATHPNVTDNFEAEQRVGFPDGMKDTTGKFREHFESEASPSKPHADKNRH